MEQARREQLPWYAWPLVPLVLPLAVVLVPVLVVLSFPYFWLCPDRHPQIYDLRGTPHQRTRLAQWRAAYRRLRLWGRVRRAVVLTYRRWRSPRTGRCAAPRG